MCFIDEIIIQIRISLKHNFANHYQLLAGKGGTALPPTTSLKRTIPQL